MILYTSLLDDTHISIIHSQRVNIPMDAVDVQARDVYNCGPVF